MKRVKLILKTLSCIFLILFFKLMLLVTLYADNSQITEKVKFMYLPNINVKSVSVAGTFNNWDKRAFLMKETKSGLWELEVDIPIGLHQYKFVINDEIWVSDPNNPETTDDGHGGKNSVIFVGKQFFNKLKLINPFDDVIEFNALMHKQNEIKYLDFIDTNCVRIILRTLKNDILSAYLIKAKNINSKFEVLKMNKYACDGIYDYYKCYFNECDSKSIYLFKVTSGVKDFYFGFKGIFEPKKDNTLYQNAFIIPDYFFLKVNKMYWWDNAIFYQIFPDRFYDGNPKLNQSFVKPWGTKPTFDNFMGGDIEGIIKKLDHLIELGVNAIYLNPIFKSNSNHKYDTIDYYQIDPTLGSLDDFKKLVQILKNNNMYIILDGVFNHTSTDFFAFLDVRKKGAKSKYVDWYNFKSFPVTLYPPNYDCWWNIGSMPKLNIKNPKVYEYLLDVASYWIKTTDIDGYRLDVAMELPHLFWKDFRKVVKKIKQDAYLVGEILGEGSDWLKGDEFDSIMNYKLRNLLISFFIKEELDGETFDQKLSLDKVNLPDSAFYSMFNLLSSHDTPRILTLCNNNINTLKNMLFFIMTYPGTPCIYYGDEIGMQGEKDPDNRACMIWDKKDWNMNVYNMYKNAIKLRNENLELKKGDIYTYYAKPNEKTYSFIRVYNNNIVLIAFNNEIFDKDFKINIRQILNLANINIFNKEKFKIINLLDNQVEEFNLKQVNEISKLISKKGFIIYKISFDVTDTK